MFRHRALAVCLVLVVATPAMPARADDNGPTLSVQFENDWFGGPLNKDRHYSTGIRANWLSRPISETPEWLREATDQPETWFGFLDDRQAGSAKRRFGLSIGQSIYTPENKDATHLLPNDRPYAAWLYFGMSLQTIRYEDRGSHPDPIRQDTWHIDIGMVGPAALGEQVQNNFHALIGDEKSRGWSNQIHNEPGINLVFERKWRIGRGSLEDDPTLQFDAIPMVGFSLGNVNTYAAVGGVVRFGRNLAADFGPPRIRPSLPGSESIENSGPFGWYVFLGTEGQAVARNIALDGNTFRNSPSVDKRPLIADISGGLAIFVGPARLAYTHVFRSKEFYGQKGFDQFGALTLTVRY